MIYNTFDTLPILNWHLLQKENNLSYLCDNEKINDIELLKAYEKLLDSKGKRELINGLFAFSLQCFFVWLLDKTPQNEQTYNDSFEKYIDKVSRLTTNNIKESYIEYYKENGYKHAMYNRLYDYNLFDLKFKPYDYDLFGDVAKVESILNISINPATCSVSHFEALKKNAKEKIKNANIRHQ